MNYFAIKYRLIKRREENMKRLFFFSIPEEDDFQPISLMGE